MPKPESFRLHSPILSTKAICCVLPIGWLNCALLSITNCLCLLYITWTQQTSCCPSLYSNSYCVSALRLIAAKASMLFAFAASGGAVAKVCAAPKDCAALGSAILWTAAAVAAVSAHCEACAADALSTSISAASSHLSWLAGTCNCWEQNYQMTGTQQILDTFYGTNPRQSNNSILCFP